MLKFKELFQAHQEQDKELVRKECLKYGQIVTLDDVEFQGNKVRKYVIIHLKQVWKIVMMNGSVTKVEMFSI